MKQMRKRSRKYIESSDEEYVPSKKRILSSDSDSDDYIPIKRLYDKSDDNEESLIDSLSSLSIDDCEDDVNYQEILEEEHDGKNTHLSKELTRLTNNIKKGQVTLTHILCCSLHDHDKETALELFGILNVCERNSLEYIQLNKLLLGMVTSDEQIDNHYIHDMPTINKILRASISKDDKLKAIELYNMFYNVSVSHLYTAEWYELKKKINTMIHVHQSPEELLMMEEKEKEIKILQPPKIDIKSLILNLDTTLLVKKKLYDMYNNMIISSDDTIKNSLHEKLTWYTKLPFNKQLVSNNSNVISSYCTTIYNNLNASLYGMYEVKEKILLYINNKFKNPNTSSILALLGDPGVGKSKIVKCLAEAVGLPYNKLSFGGAIDSTLILGSDAVWKNASPGMMVKLLCDSKCSNPIILLDEIDKPSNSVKGKEVQSALLHMLDKTQNDHFNDSFLCEVPINLSNVWFIATMNDDTHLDPALKDRLEIIKVPSYNKNELIHIIKLHVLPNCAMEHGYTKDDFIISDNACNVILNYIKKDIKTGGVRKVEEEIKNIVSKISFLDKVGYKEEFHLSFKLKDPITFPFMIDEKIVKSLMRRENEATYLSMFS